MYQKTWPSRYQFYFQTTYSAIGLQTSIGAAPAEDQKFHKEMKEEENKN